MAVSCGSTSPEWAGNWRQPVGIPAGTYVECTLGGTSTSITGSGVQHREAGTDVPFTVSGSVTGVAFTYPGEMHEAFSFVEPDRDHITLTNADRTVTLVRQ
ncbi:MAG: hypothetical protein ABR567_16710 [Myxococcales bacterium]